MLQTTATSERTFVPLVPSLAGLSTVDRMLIVMRRQSRQGQPTTFDDFNEAEETCDLSPAELYGNIGNAKRLMNVETVRHDQPPAPVMPWDLDRDYRKERVTKAAGMLVALPLAACGADAFAGLRQGFSANELRDLWSEILVEAFAIVQKRGFAVPA